MAVKDRNVHISASFAKRYLDGSPSTIAINQAGKRCFAWTAQYAGQVTDFQVYATTVTATLSFDLQINGVSCLTGLVAGVTDTVVLGVLAALSKLRFKKGDTVSVLYTTNGTGAAVNPSVMVGIRPYPVDNEAGLGDSPIV